MLPKIAASILLGTLSILPSACAPQPNIAASPIAATSLSTPSNGAASNMQGMYMSALMQRCTQVRRQMQPDAVLSPDMQRMMSQCEQSDRSMGLASPGAR